MRTHHLPIKQLFVGLVVVSGLMTPAVPAAAQQGWTGRVVDIDIMEGSQPYVVARARGGATAVWYSHAAGRIEAAQTEHPDGDWAYSGAAVEGLLYGATWHAAGDAAGNVVAVWHRNAITPRRVQAAHFWTASRTWGPVVNLSEAASDGWPETPFVAVGHTGDAVAVWVQSNDAGLHTVIQAALYDGVRGVWSRARDISAEGFARAPRAAIGSAGQIAVVWVGLGSVYGVWYDPVTQAWTSPTPLDWSTAYASYVDASYVDVAMEPSGTAVAAWSRQSGDHGSRLIVGARFSSASRTWGSAVCLDDTGQTDSVPDVEFDGVGAFVVVWERPVAGASVLRAARYLVASARWSGSLDVVSVSDGEGSISHPRVHADAAGNLVLTWTRSIGFPWYSVETVRYSSIAQALSPVRQLSLSYSGGRTQVAFDAVGNAVAVLTRGWRYTSFVASTWWLASPAAPQIASVIPAHESLVVNIVPANISEAAFATVNYEYSLDDGLTWTPRGPASAATPLVIDGLVNGISYPVRLRAVNAAGPGAASESWVATPVLGPGRPQRLEVDAVADDVVTLAWAAPVSGLIPTGYVLEGGLNPGEVLASIPTGSLVPRLTLRAPTGAFYVRVVAVADGARSAPSDEIRIFVNVPEPPSAPVNLLGLVDGSEVALSWTNTFAGGAPTSLGLNVSGSVVTTLPLPMGEGFTYVNVPPGTYTLRVIAANARGVSTPSNAVTLTFPGPCSGVPGEPTNLQTWTEGRTIFLAWSAPSGGPAVTSYTVWVGGAYVGSFRSTGRTLSGAAAPGRYELSVTATNPCGMGPATPTQTVLVP